MEKGMNTNLKLGTMWGIPVGLHISWFIIFGLLTWSLASGYFPREYPQFSGTSHLALAAVTSLLFAASVLAHELGHAFVAIRNRLPVRGITLFIFGGVAQIEREPESPGAEFRIAIAGPLVSLALGLFFGLLWLVDHNIPVLAAPSQYLMRINLILAFFNLIPGFPLDGGRVLRALLWWRTGSFQRATRAASMAGQLVAFGFIGVGLFAIFNGRFFDGMWLAFIGWFLQNAAASAQAHTNLQEVLRGVRVEQVMSTDCVPVSGLTPLSQLVEEQVLSGGKRCFYVSEDGRPHGILTLQEITSVPHDRRRFMTSRQAMLPLARMTSVQPQAELLTAVQLMENARLVELPVMQDDRLVGLLSRDKVLTYLRTRLELGI